MFLPKKPQALISPTSRLIRLNSSTLIVPSRACELIRKHRKLVVVHRYHVAPTPVPMLSLATGLIGLPRQVEKPSLTRLEMVRRF